MKVFNRLFILLILLFSLKGKAQIPTVQDCFGAVAVCQSNFSVSQLPTNGFGNFHPEIGGGSCQGADNKVSYWMKVFIKSSGNLCFTITPIAVGDDYNYSVFNLTNDSCTSLLTNAGALEVSCEYSTLTQAGQPTGPTGGNCIPVLAGETYMIYAVNYAPSTFGFSIDFSSSTALITDNTAPSIVSASALSCGTSSITFSLSEMVLCSEIEDLDFQLSASSGGPYTLSGIPSPPCGSNELDSTFTMTISPVISASSTFNLCITGNAGGISDQCGNISSSGCHSFVGQGITVIQDIVNDVTCFDGNDGSATISISGGVSPYTYIWITSPIQTLSTATGLASGNYIVQVQDSTGCTGTGTITISAPNVSVLPDLVSCDTSTCDGSATAQAIGGIGPFVCEYWDLSFTTLYCSSPPLIPCQGLCLGTYYCITIDQGHSPVCVDTTIFTITEPVVGASYTPTTCLDTCDGMAFAIPMDGSISNTYQWSDSLGNTMVGQTDSILSGFICAGLYSVQITNNDLTPPCIKTSTVTIIEPAALSGSISTYKDACFGVCDGRATMSVTGGTAPYVYSWSPSAPNAGTITGLCQGSYSVTCTDINGCPSITDSQTLLENPEIISVSGLTHTDCDVQNGQTSVQVSGGSPPYTYSWSNSSTSSSLSGLSVGTYTCITSDSVTCTDTVVVNLGYIDSNTAIIQIVDSISCKDSCNASITVQVTGGVPPYLYSWSIGSSADTIYNLCTDTIIVATTDSTGCPGYTSIILAEPDPISSFISGIDETTCFASDGIIDLTPTGGRKPYTFEWSTGDSIEDLSGLSFGTYTVTVSDAFNCPQDTNSIILIDQPRIAINIPVINASCYDYSDGIANLGIISGGASPYTFIWNTNPIQTDSNATGLSAGTYSVTVTDINNCPETSDSITITQPDSIKATLTSECLNGLGNIYVNTSGGTSPYSYSWSNGNKTDIQMNLEPGKYSVIITDINNCPEANYDIDFLPCTLMIPTAFTPNGNGENDVWDIKNLKFFPDSKMKIYNRWGDVVFKSKGYEIPWDGKHRATKLDLPTAVYYYVIENVDPKFVEAGSVLYGYVTIVR